VLINQKKSFILPEISKIPLNKVWQFLKDEPALQVYRHYLEDLFRTKIHVLTPEGEELLALSGDIGQVPYQIFSMFNNADIKFPKITNEEGKRVELTKGNFSVFLQSWNRKVRQNAYLAMYRTYQNWLNTLASSLSGAIKRDIYYASARKYHTSLEAALDADNIPLSVYQNVIDTVNKNLDPMHKYIGLRKNALGLKKVKPWDLYVPLVAKFRWEVSYEEAIQTIHNALQPLGRDYLAIMDLAFNSRWFDVFENKGKRSGAYSSAVYRIPHPYMLLNYQNMLDDMFTIAHEIGHSMHSYFTMNHQPYIYSDYTIFVAEVASTLNEALLMDYLLKTTEEKEKKIYLLNQYIDQIKGTMYIQAIFAEFEKVVHERRESGEALTAEFFNKVTREIYVRYYGPNFEIDSLYELNWCRIPHFYYNYYVYQYATGLAAASSIAHKILAGDTQALDAYLRFLKRGNSDYSINLLKDAGVDMTTPKPIEDTAKLFAALIDEMEDLIDNKKS
jgi:oligoendopeptidase F